MIYIDPSGNITLLKFEAYPYDRWFFSLRGNFFGKMPIARHSNHVNLQNIAAAGREKEIISVGQSAR